MMNTCRFYSKAVRVCACYALLCSAISVYASGTNVFYDAFDDGERDANPAWYLIKAQSTATVVDDAVLGGGNALKFDNEHSGSNPTIAPYAQKGIVASFDTVSLEPGESLTLSFDFRLQTVVDQSGLFRFGLAYDQPTNSTPFFSDGGVNGSSPGDDDYAYFVGMSSGANTGLAIREDNATINGFMSGGDIVADKGTGSFTLNDTNAHQVVFTIDRSATEPRRDFTLEIDGVEVLTGFDDYNLKIDFNEVGIVSNHRDLDLIIDNVSVTYEALQSTSNDTPYTWLDSYGLVDGGDYAAADMADSDSDSLLNWQEYLCGTDPTNANSVLTINSIESVSSDAYEVNWQSVPGKSYNLLTSSDLLSGAWATNASGMTAASGDETSTTQTVSSAAAYFQIELDL